MSRKYIGINYFGGKLDNALPTILPIIQSVRHHVYVEPFFGCGGVFFNKSPASFEIINDLDNEIINFFDVLRNKPDELIEKIELTPYARLEFAKACEGGALNDIETARDFIIKVNGSINQYHKNNSISWARSISGDGSNHPSTLKNLPPMLKLMSVRLKNAYIENSNAIDLITRYDREGILFYLDPPYVIGARRGKQKVYKHECEDSFHIELCETINSIKNANFILSGYDNSIYTKHLNRFECRSFKSYTNNRKKAKNDVLWFNFKPSQQMLI